MRLAILCFSIGLLSCSHPPEPLPSPPSPSLPTVNQHLTGVDLSNHQGQVDFQQIKQAGMTFVFIKATQGETFVDPDYAQNMAAARAAGLAAGPYHFYMTNDQPETQFANLSKTVSLQSGDLPPVVDIEVLHKGTLPEMAVNLRSFLDKIETHYGVKPILYTGVRFANEHLKDFGEYPLWIAEYKVDAPSLPQGWKGWTIWQYSQEASVAGVDGPVDANRLNGDETLLKSFLVP